MQDKFLKLYPFLPNSLRALSANLRGLYLQRQRYGSETEKLVEEALERETWSVEKWKTWLETRLAEVLYRARTKTPYYRALWDERRRKGDKSSWELLESWPILDKEEIRRIPKAFIAEDCQIKHMTKEQTSGTSGKPLQLWWSQRAVRHWYALFEARWRRWYGVSYKDPWAILGGQIIKPVNEKSPPFWIWNIPMRQLYLSSFHISDHNISDYVKAMKKYKVQYLFGYSSSLNVLAKTILDSGNAKLNLRVVITNAEPLSAQQRTLMENVFQCPIRETYGMTEMVAGASECQEGRLHLWPEAGRLEIMCGEKIYPFENATETGELIATSLLNQDMPLIRYRNGDRLNPIGSSNQCLCGRLLPAIQNIEGRVSDMVFTPDGRKIFWLNPIFYNLPIVEGQLIQTKLQEFMVLIVPMQNFDARSEFVLLQRIRERIGDVKADIKKVKKIERGPSGKFQPVINQLIDKKH